MSIRKPSFSNWFLISGLLQYVHWYSSLRKNAFCQNSGVHTQLNIFRFFQTYNRFWLHWYFPIQLYIYSQRSIFCMEFKSRNLSVWVFHSYSQFFNLHCYQNQMYGIAYALPFPTMFVLSRTFRSHLFHLISNFFQGWVGVAEIEKALLFVAPKMFATVKKVYCENFKSLQE